MGNIFSSEVQEAIKLANSPAAQEAIKLANSPAALETMQIMNSPEFQASQKALEYLLAVEQPVLLTSDIQGLLGEVLVGNIPNQALLDSLSNNLTQVEPYMPPDEKEQYEAIIKPKLKEESSSRLKLGDVLSLISILVAIAIAIVSSAPDEQTERLTDEVDVLISQQSETNEIVSDSQEAQLKMLEGIYNELHKIADSLLDGDDSVHDVSLEDEDGNEDNNDLSQLGNARD